MRREFRPAQTKPPDFDDFWETTREELEHLDPALERQRNSLSRHPGLILENISFVSIGSVRVRGYFLRWEDELRRPLIVHSHGYGGHCQIRWDWAKRGASVCGVDIRGHGWSRDALPDPSPWGYVLTGIESPETSVLRGAVCDYMQAVRVFHDLLGPCSAMKILEGQSFAGGLAMMAEALLGVADLLALGVPTFGWAAGRYVFARQGSGGEINRFLERRPDRFEDVMVVLRYFDLVNFADCVHCPVLLGIGLQDHTVPAKTVFAAANHLSGPHEIMEFPMSHSDHPEEQQWREFDQTWMQLAREGIPSDFGVRRFR